MTARYLRDRMFSIDRSPAPGLLRALYGRYYGPASGDDRCASSHWRRHSAQIRVSIDRNGNVTELVGSGFGLVRDTHLLNKAVHALCNMSYLLRLPGRAGIWRLMRRARRVLRAAGAYLSYENFRQLYALDAIMRHMKTGADEAFDVLLIGDGYGFLSAMVKTVYPRARIVLVDLGKVLFFQAVYLQRIFPALRHEAVPAARGAGGDFIYCPAEDLGSLGDLRYKLVVNIASMQEMDRPAIERYFSYLRSHMAPDGLFYCCNREEKVLPGGEVIRFAEYPWREGDRHIVDEACRFYRYHLSLRPPFYHRFAGPLRHRLSALERAGMSDEAPGENRSKKRGPHEHQNAGRSRAAGPRQDL